MAFGCEKEVGEQRQDRGDWGKGAEHLGTRGRRVAALALLSKA